MGRPEDIELANALERVQGLLEKYEPDNDVVRSACEEIQATLLDLIDFLRGEPTK